MNIRVVSYIGSLMALFAAFAWMVSALSDTGPIRSLLELETKEATTLFQSEMNAWAAGFASIAAMAQAFTYRRD